MVDRIDAHTWEHHDKAVARGYPAAAVWEHSPPNDLWLAEIDDMVSLSLAANEERCRLMLEDINALPPTPVVIAEGTPLAPWLIHDRLASKAHAVWLAPTAEFQAARLRSRPRTTFERTSDPSRALANRIERELRVGELLVTDAKRRGLNVLPVSDKSCVEDVLHAVEEVFAPTLAAGPRANTPQARRAIRRDANLTLYSQVSTYFERVPGAGDRATSPIPFNCECGAAGCDATTPVALADACPVLDGSGWLRATGHTMSD